MAKGEKKDDDRKVKLRTAYGLATTALRKNHQDEFNTLYQTEAKALGIDWSPRPSEQEQAETLFDELVTKYPHLRDRLAAEEGATA